MRAFLIRFVRIYATMVAVLVVGASSAVGTYLLVHRDRLFPKAYTVVVYGRDTCSITTAMRSFLQQKNVPFVYASVDNPFVDQEMWYFHDKIAPGLANPNHAEFPLVRINGNVLESPQEEVVLSLYQRAKDKISQ